MGYMAHSASHTTIVGDINEILDHMRQNHTPKKSPSHMERDEKERVQRVRHYNRFVGKDTEESYYRVVTVCKLLFYDITHHTNMHIISRYAEGIDSISPEDIEKIYYDSPGEDYVVKTPDTEYRIYKGDIRRIYRFYCDIPDSVEYDLVCDGSQVYTTAKHNETVRIPVFSK